MVIWKYELKITDRQCVSIPAQSEILSVENQRGRLCMWVMVDPNKPTKVDCNIEIVGTGYPISEGQRNFLGTVIIEPLVWHVFERLG